MNPTIEEIFKNGRHYGRTFDVSLAPNGTVRLTERRPRENIKAHDGFETECIKSKSPIKNGS